MNTEPIILKHMTDDFISNELFNDMIKHNLNGESTKCKELTPELCEVPGQFLDKINANGLEDVVVSTLIQNRNYNVDGKKIVYKGVNYGRFNEGYAGPLVYLQFQKPVDQFSIAYIEDLKKGEKLKLIGDSEDALYFFEHAVINIDKKEYIVQPNTFVFLKNNGLYSIKSLSKNKQNYVKKNPYPKKGITPTGILLVRHGEHELIKRKGIEQKLLGVNRSNIPNFNNSRLTSQWAIMYFDKDCIAKLHTHTQKEEVFYFFNNLGMINREKFSKDLKYEKTNGFVCVEPTHVHSLNSIYDEVWFHSTNMPAKLNDSERLVK